METAQEKPKIAFFGTPELVVPILEELKTAGFSPDLIVTASDKPKGRGLEVAPPPAKVWAEENGIPVLQPEKLNSEFTGRLSAFGCDLFIVVAYGKILPENVINMPRFGAFNIHYSLLPKYRGASPVESAVLNDEKETGVTIQKMIFELDAGPVVALEKISIGENETAPELRNRLNDAGKKLLIETIPKIIAGTAVGREQNATEATYSKKIRKEDGLIDPNAPAKETWRKYRAFYGWPGVYFFVTRKKGKIIRVTVKDAALENGKFAIKRVLPEGGREMEYADFLRGL